MILIGQKAKEEFEMRQVMAVFCFLGAIGIIIMAALMAWFGWSLLPYYVGFVVAILIVIKLDRWWHRAM